MLKDASYHKSAIQYNEELAIFAEGLSGRLEHPEVSRWARSVSKQHKFHAGRHKQALSKMENPPEETRDEVVHRSSVSGKFVTEEAADASPDTTEEEVVDIPVGPGNVDAENAEVQA